MLKLVAVWNNGLDHFWDERIFQDYSIINRHIIHADRNARTIKAVYLAMKGDEIIGLVRICDLNKQECSLYEVHNLEEGKC